VQQSVHRSSSERRRSRVERVEVLAVALFVASGCGHDRQPSGTHEIAHPPEADGGRDATPDGHAPGRDADTAPLAPTQVDATPAPTGVDTSDIAGLYSPPCAVGSWGEVVLEPNGRYLWKLHSCMGPVEHRGVIERSGTSITLVPDPGETAADRSAYVLVKHGGRDALIEASALRAFERRRSIRMELVKLAPGEERLTLCGSLPEDPPDQAR
jgi:hypothetical protein